MAFANRLILLLLLLAVGCGEVGRDLAPSGRDRRPEVAPGSVGFAVGQSAPDFSATNTLGNTVSLAALLAADRPVVLYFTMWCPICDAEMSHMASAIAPAHPDAAFLAVDYVSGSVAESRAAQVAAGYGNSLYTVLADADRNLLNACGATMSTTLLIDKTGVVRMNEDYRDGAKLAALLALYAAREVSP